MKILIVDDLPENIYLLESLFKANGNETISAQNGQDAFDLATKDQPDIIVSDVLIPFIKNNTLNFCPSSIT